MTSEQTLQHLPSASAVARAAMAQGHHPFGAIVVDADAETVLLEQGNVDTVEHADDPTLDLLCREVFARGQKPIEVVGPVAEAEAEIAALHRAFWSAG